MRKYSQLYARIRWTALIWSCCLCR